MSKKNREEMVRRAGEVFQAALFDLDGTLADSEVLIRRAWLEVFARHRRDISGFEYGRIIGKTDLEAAHILIKHCKLRLDPVKVYWEHQKAVDAMIALEASARDGVPETLRAFRYCKVPMGVVTSSRLVYAKRLLRKIGVARNFKALVTADDPEIAARKPAPDPYLRGATLLSADPAKVIAFEDSPIGVTSAKAAGMFVVAVPHPDSPVKELEKADVVIGSFREFNLSDFI